MTRIQIWAKKEPPEVSRTNPFAFALYLGYQCEYLVSFYRSFDFGLRVAYQIVIALPDAANAVHDILSVGPLVKNHIAAPKLPCRVCGNRCYPGDESGRETCLLPATINVTSLPSSVSPRSMSI